MATETPPGGSMPGGFDADDEFEFEFDPAEDLEPTNEFVDVVLTRVGEFTLDVIEAVQEHPVLTASLLAAGAGLLAGTIAGGLFPRRPNAAARAAEAAAAAAAASAAAMQEAGLSRRWSLTSQRLGASLEDAGAGLRERGAQAGGVLGRLRHRARGAEPDLSAVADLAASVDGRTPGQLADQARRTAKAASQLFPVALALLRNDIVRDLVASAVAGRLRQRGRF